VTEPLLTFRGSVYPWQCDHMGHVNVAHYVGMFDQATWHLFHALGLGPSVLRSSGRGMAAVDQQLQYLRELHPGDVVSVTTRVLEVKARTVRFEHTMLNDETAIVAARCTLVAVHLDTTARRAIAFEPAVVARAEALAGPPAG
jgi:acyl-CoA thioester hydrolase